MEANRCNGERAEACNPARNRLLVERYIDLAPNHKLDTRYSSFAVIESGLDVALAIARRETPDEAQLARVTLALSGLGDFGPKVPEPVEGIETVELSVVACDEPTRT